MSNKAVIGLGFGDEGKGVTTEYLCAQDPENTIVVRFSGGQQCGHKVIKGGVEHIFSNFGSGTLNGCPTYWSKHCTFDPRGFWTEYEILKAKGISPKIYIHPDCAVTTPYDVLVGQNPDGRERKHGTTGTGIYRTKKRHFTDGLTFTTSELLCGTADDITHKLKEIADYYVMDKEDIGSFARRAGAIRNLIKESIVTITDQVPDYKHRVFEGNQGLMLDEHIGTMPHCTPSDITPRNIFEMGFDLDEIVLVTRAYQTRHGNGPMTNEELPLELTNTEKETNVLREFQGEFRTSVLDLDQLIHAKTEGIDKIVGHPAPKISLNVTCLDQVRPYQVTEGQGKITFYCAALFVDYLGLRLDITGRLYMNDSPYSDVSHYIAP